MKEGDYPYVKEEVYQWALKSQADIVLMMMGTSDAKEGKWDPDAFRSDYLEMATAFKNMPSQPYLYLMVPPPLYEDGVHNLSQKVINGVMPTLISEVAGKLGLPSSQVIDVWGAMGGKGLSNWEFFCDGQSCDSAYPNNQGYTVVATEVYKRLFLIPLSTD